MKNHNFENKIIQTFQDEEIELSVPKARASSKTKAKIYLTLISLAVGAFGLILVMRGLFLFNPLAFNNPENPYQIGLNKPLGLKSINISQSDFPSSYPANLQNVRFNEGLYFYAVNRSSSLVGFLDEEETLHKTVWVNTEVKKILPLSNGDYYLIAAETPSQQSIELLSYEGDSVTIKIFDSKVIFQDLLYDSKERAFIFSYLNEDGSFVVEGLTVTNKKQDYYKGNLDEGTRVINYNSDKFFFYNEKECFELSLEDKVIANTDCKTVPLKNSDSRILYTDETNDHLEIKVYDQENGVVSNLVKVAKDSIIRRKADTLIIYSMTDGLSELNLEDGKLSNISEKFENIIIKDIFKIGSSIFLKSQITNSLYKYDESAVDIVSGPASYPNSSKIELQRTIDGLNLNDFRDFIVYLPDNLYTL